ncbi:MAG: sigma-70 family RNA polymerase sigma factor [Myxococcales bacterium]|nr:sigma-70 family RNA polymerase sigma factor [Myxococcales bacterium]
MGLTSDEIARLFGELGPLIFQRALRLLGGREDAEEAAQEVFVRVLRAADDYDDRAKLLNWVYRITTRYCLNQIRDRRRRQELMMAHGPREDALVTRRSPEAMLTVRRLLATAPEDEAQAAIHVLLDGMSLTDAAAEMGISRRKLGRLLDAFQQFANHQVALVGERSS